MVASAASALRNRTPSHSSASMELENTTQEVTYTLRPILPTTQHRYSQARSALGPPQSSLQLSFGPMLRGHDNDLPDDWKEYIHPEGGQLYYSKDHEFSPGQTVTIVTDHPLRQRSNHAALVGAVQALNTLLPNPSIDISSDCEICIVVDIGEELHSGYYVAQNVQKTVFYLDGHRDIVMRMTADMARLHYWRHVTHFASHAALNTSEQDQELTGLLAMGSIDHELNSESTFPGDRSTLDRLAASWKVVQSQDQETEPNPYRNWITAKIWVYFLQAQISSGYGTDSARLDKTVQLDSDEERLGKAPHRNLRWLLNIVQQLVLFNEPYEVMLLVHKACPGGEVYDKAWTIMIDKLLSDCAETLRLSAIAFAGALAFMTIPADPSAPPSPSNSTVTTGNTTAPNIAISWGETSMPIACPVISCIFALSSIIAALSVTRGFSGRIRTDALKADGYLRSLRGGWLGLDFKLGLYLSLPRVLFTWAIVSFAIGLLFLAYLLHTAHPVVFYIEVGLTLLLVVLLLLIWLAIAPITNNQIASLGRNAGRSCFQDAMASVWRSGRSLRARTRKRPAGPAEV